ncbi:hypothetical protein NM208_g14517 [Fusarium decemcellulare]|uniref:Uncharacterized protein n=1 Tax=Fusarium decemcellulare TaxID=57161 RepID=A0ACC1RGB9_9HYPO|nr:hypothetical protein NM208_g14517 [Fusarium decemcellulare]
MFANRDQRVSGRSQTGMTARCGFVHPPLSQLAQRQKDGQLAEKSLAYPYLNIHLKLPPTRSLTYGSRTRYPLKIQFVSPRDVSPSPVVEVVMRPSAVYPCGSAVEMTIAATACGKRTSPAHAVLLIIRTLLTLGEHGVVLFIPSSHLLLHTATSTLPAPPIFLLWDRIIINLTPEVATSDHPSNDPEIPPWHAWTWINSLRLLSAESYATSHVCYLRVVGILVGHTLACPAESA